MLKSKESYVNEKAYARAFFLHNSHVTDYPIDPVVGSFIRVIKPREDQPMGDGKGYYTRPQVLFFGNGECSQLYELADMRAFKNHLDILVTAIDNPSMGGEVNFRKSPFSSRQNSIFFKTNALNESNAYLVANPAARAKSYKEAIIDNLLDTMYRIIADIPPKSNILHVEDMSMTVIHYRGNGVRDPIIMSGRRMIDRDVNYIMVRRGKELLSVPSSPEHDSAEYISMFLDAMKESSELVLAQPELKRVVRFIKEQDENMEYVNACFVDLTTGPASQVMINSDRYAVNRKLILTYNPEYHDQFKSAVVEFCNQFSAI